MLSSETRASEQTTALQSGSSVFVFSSVPYIPLFHWGITAGFLFSTSEDFQLPVTDFSGSIHRWAARERCYKQEQAKMNRREDGNLPCFYASLASSALGSTLLHSMLQSDVWISLQNSHCLHTRALVPDFQVAMVFSSLSYHSKSWHLFFKICTLGFSLQFVLFVIITFYQKISTLSPPIFSNLSL